MAERCEGTEKCYQELGGNPQHRGRQIGVEFGF